MFKSISGKMNGAVMPGWEPERMAKIKELFGLYREIDAEALFRNLQYLLEAVMPLCGKYGITLAIHPDDPARSVFGLPRIVNHKANILRLMWAVDDLHNGLILCTGSLGTSLQNDIPDIIRSLKVCIDFAHVRNLRFNDRERDFEESAHLSSDGTGVRTKNSPQAHEI